MILILNISALKYIFLLPETLTKVVSSVQKICSFVGVQL